MKFALRNRSATPDSGVEGPLRILRRSVSSADTLQVGDIVLIDHVDLDRVTAQRLADAGVSAVIHASTLVSGRFPNRGPQVLLDAGIHLVDGLGETSSALKAGQPVRIDGARVLVDGEVVAEGRQVDSEVLAADLERASAGMTSQLASFTHNSTEFLRREQDVLLHGEGVPSLRTKVGRRPVVVVVDAHDWRRELKALKPFLREQHPVVIGVGTAAEAMSRDGLRPDVVVVNASEAEQPRAKVLRKASDVVALVDRGAGSVVTEQYERIGVRPLRFETGATAEDAALLVAERTGTDLIVGVGMHATLEDFLDRNRPGLASTYLTRLKVGPMLVDASTVPRLYAGAVRPRHVLAVAAAGLAALGVAVGITPVGQEFLADLAPTMHTLIDHVRGIVS